jgi:hypothetical protein
MSLWTYLKSFWTQDSQKLLMRPIPADHVRVDPPITPMTNKAKCTYVRLRLAEMFLTKQTDWGVQWYPAVHSLVQFQMGDQTVEIPNIADTSRIGGQKTDRGDIIARNFVLTPAVPFNGGLMELSAGLIAIKGANYFETGLKTLGNFAALLNVPQVSSMLELAQPLASGIQDIMSGGDGHLHLSIHDSYQAGQLQAGYIAAIRAKEADLKQVQLWVVDGELREGTSLEVGKNEPFTRFDHMVFRVDIFEERDDWESLSPIWNPFQQALDDLADPSTETRALSFLRMAQSAARKSADLTIADRRRVPAALQELFDQAKNQQGRAGLMAKQSLGVTRTVKSVMSAEQAAAKGEPSLEEVFAGRFG